MAKITRLKVAPAIAIRNGASDGATCSFIVAGIDKIVEAMKDIGIDAISGTRHKANIRRHIRSTYDMTHPLHWFTQVVAVMSHRLRRVGLAQCRSSPQSNLPLSYLR